MVSRDPLDALVFEALDESLQVWVDRVNDLMLWMVASPDGREIVIFNDDHLERGCMLVKASGEIKAEWGGRPWAPLDQQMALDHMKDHLAS